MTNPNHYLIRIFLFIIVIAILISILIVPIYDAFMANPGLNGFILATFVIGAVFISLKVALLGPEVKWITTYRVASIRRGADQRPPKLLAPIATMLGSRQDGNISLSAMSLRSLLDSIDARLSESRDTSRYLIGLLIFLGLLGTFWGLLETVSAVSKVIGGLSIENENLEDAFSGLKTGLSAPLSGMATAFSSSLFGLAGSLALGFLDLQLGQAQNRFYKDLEEWLSGLTKLSTGGSTFGDGETSASAYQAALFEQTAESLDRLQRVIVRNEDERQEANKNLIQINESLSVVIEELKNGHATIGRLAETQTKLNPLLSSLAKTQKSNEPNDANKVHLKNIEKYLGQLLEDMRSGRDKSIDEIRQEIRLLARTIAALAEDN
ncbi:MAG: flagellar motor protein MotA [Rhodospirillaceae bacterium]|nr:flagellar motor protein MotA [Rhodospirillaceae bacterium]